MPYAIAIGVDEQRFWELTPRKIKPYEKAYLMREETYDTHMWHLGQYVMSAVAVVLSDKKHKVDYVKKPFLTEMREKRELENMSEEEKIRQTKLFFDNLMQMQKRFEKSKGDN